MLLNLSADLSAIFVEDYADLIKMISHRRDAEVAEKRFINKITLRPLRLCGEKNIEIRQ